MAIFQNLKGTTESTFTIGGAAAYKAGGTDVPVTDGGTGASTAQAAINALTGVSGATNEHILTKDTATGNAIFKAPALKSKSFIITAPVSGSNSPVWRAPEAITVASVSGLCIGGTNVIGHVWKHDTNGASGASLGASDITATAGTNVTTSSLVSASLTTGQYIGWKTTSVSGVITRLIVTFDYN